MVIALCVTALQAASLPAVRSWREKLAEDCRHLRQERHTLLTLKLPCSNDEGDCSKREKGESHAERI